MGCRHYNAKDVIVRYGDIGDSFFVILRGSVDVEIPNSIFGGAGTDTCLPSLAQLDSALKSSSTDMGLIEDDADEELTLMRKVDVVREGGSFGELSLLNR
jgi:CRP-like cAMP-binding protein